MNQGASKSRRKKPAAAAPRPAPGQGTPERPSKPARGQAERQGFDRQRFDPQDHPPAEVLDHDNIAGEKDFELQPPGNTPVTG